MKRFTADHEWVKVENGIGTVGITQYAQNALGDVVFVEVPVKGTKIKRKDALGAVESVKAASDVYSPVSGTVLEANTELTSEPSLINVSPEGDGWLAKIKLDDAAEIEELMDEKAYKVHCEQSASH